LRVGERAGEQVRETAADALSNLLAVLELAEDGQLRCGAAAKRPAAATVRLVDDALVGGDFYDAGDAIAAYAWPLLVQFGGLARLAGAGLEPTRAGADALARPGYHLLAALWHRWLKIVSFDELARVDVIRGQRKQATLTSAVKRRAAVAAALAALEPGSWADTDLIWQILQTDEAPLVAVRGLPAQWRLYIGDPYHGSLGHAGQKAWEMIEGRYALCVLFEYAATMGVVDVRYTDAADARDDYRFLWGTGELPYLSRYDGLAAVRVNELGAAILHDPESVTDLTLPVPRRGH
jgi:hypothetical protein